MTNPIRLGLMPPLTGLVDIYGPEITWAARIACEEINEQGGILGRRLELVVEDDGSLPVTAVPAACRLVDDHECVAIIGNLLSNSRIAVAAQVAESKRIPLLNFSFYEGSIAGRYFFNFAALPNQQIDRMIPYMAARYGPKMFFAGNNYEWPRGSVDAAKLALARVEGDIVGEEYLPLGASRESIEHLLHQVRNSGADVFVPYFAGADQIALLNSFTEMGLKKHMAVVMGHYDEVMAACLPPHVREGFYSSNTYFMTLDTPENRCYLERLARQPGINGIWPQGNGVLTNFGEGAYLCVHAFARAVEAAGATEAEALVDALERVLVRGPQGLVEMDARTHHASVHTYLSRCNADGSFSIVEDFGVNPPCIPERYQDQIQVMRMHESQTSPQVAARLAAEVGAAMRRVGTAQQILSLADMAILAADANGLITETNPSACKMFGYDPEEMLGMSIHLLLPPHFRQRHAELVKAFIAGDEHERRMAGRSELTGYRKDGSFFPLEASIAKFRNGQDWLLVATLRDVTERKLAEESLTWRATHDPLTGLPNRDLIRERLTNALHRSRRSGLSVALLFVDLDGFKLINDSHGHAVGDMALKAVADRLIAQVRPGDTVARLAGDEFVVLCEQLEQPAVVAALADRINDILRVPVEVEGLSALFVTASIGVAIGTGSTHSADDMLRYADTAMYAVKLHGRDGWQFFNESLQEKARHRLSITNGLRLAIERNELSLRFQPIVVTESGRIVGGEVLLRWHPPEGEMSPGVFIPIAELTGAIVPIGSWVFRRSCETEVNWRSRWGGAAPYVSVNLSARQLGEESLVEDFVSILKETGADASRLLLEITETSLMANVDANLRMLRRLTDLGLRLAVDDFGTGYSSLSQLTRLPVNVLKIDRAFVDGIEKSQENRAVIRAVTGLGRALGLQLVAEGVENVEQQMELRAHHCDYCQGYYFHQPLMMEQFIDRVNAEMNRTGSPAEEVSLHFLIYVSRATAPMSADDLASLLKQARNCNRAEGITGCLIHQDGYFMQMLEGRREAIAQLMDRIRTDPRHQDVRLVIEGPAQRRVFQDWGMALRDISLVRNVPDFRDWQRRTISFLDLADDPRTCYAYITACVGGNLLD
ncbi:EAL domain-containing protein [Denitratisoma oestradiolicum]|uniref:Diguanylate cyclase n=1 Tax=Denitratisoma oestradiolicum TaxID=311182 RepID=A0A6S6XZ07_9PROT|nr:EAL domain-containing protein [Denitratisoma oestradiolicum]TWO79876.1 diguanylate cyclase [Denitratisoma oestradiolicum]CAB1369627.1 Diguanylate cyclase [Denitratisoma oestradiolicum]